jgi:divalent metal cation (Fe/Co/Zn/Cd) transporter
VVALAVGLVLLAAFARIERRSHDPLVPPRLLANPVLMLAVAIGCMFMVTFGSLLYFLSISFQDVRGHDALQTGVAFLVPTAVVVASVTSTIKWPILRHILAMPSTSFLAVRHHA